MDEYERGFKDGYKDGLQSRLCEELTPFMQGLMVGISDAIKGVPKYIINHMELKAYADNWISVKDKMPEEYGDVLVFRVYNQRPMMSVDTYDTDRKRFSKYHNCGITHWMPLPEPPESEDE